MAPAGHQLTLDLVGRLTAVQRKEPVAFGRRTHGVRHQADIQACGKARRERQQDVGQRPPLLLPRPHPANGRSFPAPRARLNP